MKIRWQSRVATVLCTVLLTATVGAADGGPVSRAQFDQWVEDLSNWGRWGAEDQLGTLNLVTPAVRAQAARLVRDGDTISLALDLNTTVDPLNTNPFRQALTLSTFSGHQVAGDEYAVSYHGFAHSHMDGLPHFIHKGKMYNGVPVDELKPEGAARLGIHNAYEGIFTRGVLIDMPAFKGVDYLEPGYAITVDDLESWERANDVRVGSGDALLVRTGRWERVRQKGQWNFVEAAAGLHVSVAAWLRERDVAIIGSDGVSDAMPSAVPGLANPLHELVLVSLGMCLLDNLDLDPLAEAVQEKGRVTFLLVGAPLRVVGGTGSPMNPLAVF